MAGTDEKSPKPAKMVAQMPGSGDDTDTTMTEAFHAFSKVEDTVLSDTSIVDIEDQRVRDLS
jgi:hypothetical protein